MTVVVTLTRKALAIDVDQGIKGEQVVETMTQIVPSRGAPQSIRVDNEPEFISKALDRWAYGSGVTLDSSAQASRWTMPLWNRSTAACGAHA